MIDLEQHWKDRVVVDGSRLQRSIVRLQNALIDIRKVSQLLRMAEYKQDGREQFPVLLSESEVEIISAGVALEKAIRNLNDHMARFVVKKSALFHNDYPEVYLADLIKEMVNKIDEKDSK